MEQLYHIVIWLNQGIPGIFYIFLCYIELTEGVTRMDRSEFSVIRNYLEKSQTQMARLLGISSRAVQSFEQGWRKVPSSVEKQMLFLRYTKVTRNRNIQSCWEITNCDLKAKDSCPAWEFQTGEMCWFINGTICNGTIIENWNKKMAICRKCDYYRYLFADWCVYVFLCNYSVWKLHYRYWWRRGTS